MFPLLPELPPPLVAGSFGAAGVLAGALALGIRHGIDWDHIAAITDITSTTTAFDADDERLAREPALMLTDERHHALLTAGAGAGAGGGSLALATAAPVAAPRPAGPPAKSGPLRVASFIRGQRRSLFLGTVYALGHGSMVVLLGLLAILFAEILPAWVDPIMEKVVGLTLLFLGIYLAYSLYRYFRGGGEFRIRSRWMLVFAVVRRGWRRLRARILPGHSHSHGHPGEDGNQQYGVATSYGIGLIHGIGAETGTQVLIIGTAVGAGSKGMSVATLFVFVVGVLISNSIITVMSAAGFVSAGRRQAVYVSAGAVAAAFSLALGLIYLGGSGDLLPNLDPYLRWIGGPTT